MSNQLIPEQDKKPKIVDRVDSWFDDRTGIDSILHESLDEPIHGGASWAYIFGSGLLFLFMSQVITGVFLALYYVPSADHAHTVVSYIVKVVSAGSFIRSIHAYGSSGIIILLCLHIGQTVLYGSYKGRRELLWLSGCILMALMLGMAFTGYLLPWDEKAYFATAVGTNLIAEVPWIGPILQKLVRGGDQMGTLTLSRFFVFHVFILPGMLIAFIVGHIFFFRKAGAAGPIKEDPVNPRLPSVPFYPRQVFMDAAFAIVLIGILAVIAKTIPMDLGPAANPADTHFLPRPEWYYRPAFQWLKYLSGRWSLVGGIMLPALLALIFAAAPFLDRRLERRPWKRPISVGAFFLFLIVYTGLGIASYRDDYSDPSMASQMHAQDADARRFMAAPFVPESTAGSVSANLASADPMVAKGHALFQAQSCNSCHGEGGVGTAAAGALTGVAGKYTDAQLEALLQAPNSTMSGGGMQPVVMKPADLEALSTYLRQLH
ncbi:cytochrome b N-terminal domain-containing protein [Terriglobus saanensis]|uniref:Cytochrome b/b6 domain protein n=1 Tax=Terriglobus saanensis (strain ATCC BAA-1853 / DSM 23119 / SP1PR4) TaxID=401053 RepID=E8UYF3_TERSS|nr:cytochrome b N-terminal domain-containing protein [Terriglobus saanensis]ADV82041.1 Cytochrome b/b6 domain protein [Terriglobus saanensis SP1PR4]